MAVNSHSLPTAGTTSLEKFAISGTQVETIQTLRPRLGRSDGRLTARGRQW